MPALAEPDIPTPPDRDLQELAQRLVPGYTKSKDVVPADPLEIGDKVDFWVLRDEGSVIVSGEVSHVSSEQASKVE